MRADRLISMLMILQTRSKVTARELAAELEVLVGQKSYERLASRLDEECGP